MVAKGRVWIGTATLLVVFAVGAPVAPAIGFGPGLLGKSRPGGATATTMTAVGLGYGVFNNTFYEAGQSLPTGWGVTSGSNWNKIQGNASVTCRANQGSVSQVHDALANLRWTISTTEFVDSTTKVTFLLTSIQTGSVAVNAMQAGTSASSGSDLSRVKLNQAMTGVGEAEHDLTRQHSIRTNPRSLVWTGSGTKTATLDVLSSMVLLSTRASENISGGNVTVATASSMGSEKIFLSDMRIATDALFGTVTPSHLTTMSIDIVGQDSFWTNVESGTFGMDTTPYDHGTYDVYLTAPYCLRRHYQWVFQSGEVTGVQVNIPFGDLNEDGSITANEAGVILGYLQKTPADAEWFDVVDIGGKDWMVGHLDFNRDKIIDSNDYNMVAPNVGLVSDP